MSYETLFLENAIQEGFQYSPIYNERLANHFPMLSYCLFDLNKKYGVKNTNLFKNSKKDLELTTKDISYADIDKLSMKHKKIILGNRLLLND